ncbi:retrovirus-related Pol polyprotein from transposon 412 [Trichonephila clavipes]|nr:retrovirus-related Pol polyprotein from transposon 412 [Trichonephila clavipes]
MSPTFEQHLADLEAVFKRLMDFKLRANRENCQFSCSRFKYLGHWIIPQGIEVDHEKTSAILGIPPPKNVKQLQSFLQTCSWYRKFIANFSEIARPVAHETEISYWKTSLLGSAIAIFQPQHGVHPGKCNAVADMLSRPECHEENELCEVYTVAIDVLSRYAPDSESEEAQLVVPSHEITLILKNHHDAPMAAHYGAEGTYTRIAKNHY